MKRIRYSIIILLFFSLAIYGCEREHVRLEYKTDYKVEPKTDVGVRLVTQTELIGHLFSDSTYTLIPGLTATEVKYLSQEGLAMKLFVFEVDLNQPNISIIASMPNDGVVFGMQKMTEQALHADKPERKVWGGVNGDFYNMTTGVPASIVYKNSTAIKTTFHSTTNTYFALLKDKTAVVAGQNEYPMLKNQIAEAVGGQTWLVQDGGVVLQTGTDVHPRTCIGVSADGKTVYVLAVDGRNFWHSNGMTYRQQGEALKALGAHNAINLDGGGSTTFFIRTTSDFSDNRFQIRNWVSDKGGMERAVGNGLLIVSNE